MTQVRELFGTSVTAPDIQKASQFYQQVYPCDEVKQGVFAGINYIALLRAGEVGVCIFEQGEGNPLADSFPTYRVDSVAMYANEVQARGGSILLPENLCPCTEAPFAICIDPDGHQFMIKEAKAQQVNAP
jgi:predicted enzyme related to lactoylglutathione lyase